MAGTGEANRGRLLRLLPALFQEQPGVEALLGVFEQVLFDGSPEAPGLAARIDEVPRVFDAHSARQDFLPWLASCVGLRLPAGLSEDAQRALVAQAVPLYQRRGTRAGLQQLLDIVTDRQAKVVEPDVTGFRVGAAVVGRSTHVGRDRPHYFEVVLRAGAGRPDESRRLERLTRTFVDLAKPAHTSYTLRVVDEGTDGPRER